MKPVEIYVNLILTESFRKNVMPNYYVTLNGKKIKFGDKKSIEDLQYRIQDASRVRDSYPARTDGRVYFSGILRILRRELKAAQKVYQNLPN
jgi:hypothetical protein